MTYYRVVGEGSQASEPIEHIVSTATEAKFHCNALRRICGKLGKVEVWTRNGRKISPGRLEKLAEIEKSEVDKFF